MNTKLGICLSGGGARGIAHIGVLQALDEQGITPDYLSGASAGSIVGALYAAGKTPGEILEIFKTTSLLKVFKPSLSTLGLTDLVNIKSVLADHISIDSFEALNKKLFISVTNLSKGRYEIASQGPLFDMVVTSCSIPLLFTSRKLQNDIYVDGGVLNNLPIEPLKEHCDLTIGVNVTPIDEERDLSDALKIGVRMFDLIMWTSVEHRLELCDVVIQPKSDDYHLFDVWKADEIFQQGYDAAMGQMPALKAFLGSDKLGKSKAVKTSASPYNQVMKKNNSSLPISTKSESLTSASKVNLPPGTMVYIGPKRIGKSVIGLMDYKGPSLVEKGNVSPEELLAYRDSDQVTWINTDGVHDLETIKSLGEIFQLHALSTEDIVNTTQRPKLQIFENYLYLVARMIRVEGSTGLIDIEQVSLVLGKNLVMSFQEKSEDVLEPLRERIRQSRGKIRQAGSDYLFFAILDALVSNYFLVSEALEERIVLLEDTVYKSPGASFLSEVKAMKSSIFSIHQSVSPLYIAVKELTHDENLFLGKKVYPYLKDLQDQLLRIMDSLDARREELNSIRDQYLALSSHKMNEVMKVLTIVATLFIPLTFIAGIYGMNFENMPELGWKNGYFMAWGLMGLVAAGMLVFFRIKKWI